MWLMTHFTTSPVLIALMQTATALPVFLVGLLAGALADIVNCRRLLLASQGLILGSAAALAVLTYMGLMNAPLLLTKAIEVGSERDSGSVCLPESELFGLLVERLGWSEGAVKQVLESLILEARPDFLTPPPPFLKSDVHPWQFNRRLSYLRRPFLRRRRGNGAEILWGHRHLYNAGGYLSDLCLNGRLQARSREMQQAISQINIWG
jgi:Transmembrane secretion effector